MKKIKNYLLNLLAKHRQQKAFTLIEMVVVIAIVALLILIIAPNLAGQKDRADHKTQDAFKATLQTQVDLYKDEHHQVKSFDELRQDGFLTEKQLKRAEGYRINEKDEVVAK
jgi:competence protein ComGC